MKVRDPPGENEMKWIDSRNRAEEAECNISEAVPATSAPVNIGYRIGQEHT